MCFLDSVFVQKLCGGFHTYSSTAVCAGKIVQEHDYVGLHCGFLGNVWAFCVGCGH